MHAVTTLTLLAGALILMGCDAKPKNQQRPIDSMFQKDGTLTFERADGTPLATIDIEISDTPQKRETGLMGRPMLGEKNGMLFIFEQDQPLSFWMMNCLIALDMIFVDASGTIITIHERTVPFSTDSYSSTSDGRYVVEVNAGFCAQFGISEGDRIVWKKNGQ